MFGFIPRGWIMIGNSGKSGAVAISVLQVFHSLLSLFLLHSLLSHLFLLRLSASLSPLSLASLSPLSCLTLSCSLSLSLAPSCHLSLRWPSVQSMHSSFIVLLSLLALTGLHSTENIANIGNSDKLCNIPDGN